jgi:hypothetical protein
MQKIIFSMKHLSYLESNQHSLSLSIYLSAPVRLSQRAPLTDFHSPSIAHTVDRQSREYFQMITLISIDFIPNMSLFGVTTNFTWELNCAADILQRGRFWNMPPNSNVSGWTKKLRTGNNIKDKKRSKKTKTDENRENQKPVCLKTDLWSVFGLLKTDRFRFRSRFPAGL